MPHTPPNSTGIGLQERPFRWKARLSQQPPPPRPHCPNNVIANQLDAGKLLHTMHSNDSKNATSRTMQRASPMQPPSPYSSQPNTDAKPNIRQAKTNASPARMGKGNRATMRQGNMRKGMPPSDNLPVFLPCTYRNDAACISLAVRPIPKAYSSLRHTGQLLAYSNLAGRYDRHATVRGRQSKPLLVSLTATTSTNTGFSSFPHSGTLIG